MNRYETDLVEKAQMGDEQAFNELYRFFYKQAYYFALKITNCDADAQDAVQESFITIKRSITDLREAGNFRKWMLQIVLSKCNKIFRKNKYPIWDPDMINAYPVEERRFYMSGDKHVDRLSRHEWLLGMISQLTIHQREILVLMYFHQLSIKEIGEVLDIPEGTVKSRLVSAKSALKRKMDQNHEVRYFRAWMPLPLLLLGAYRSDYMLAMKEVPHLSYSRFVRHEPHMLGVALATTAIAVTCGVGYEYMQSAVSDSMMEKVYTNETGSYTQKEIYYMLKDWAHCHIEMEQKTKEEYEQILPYYTFLKEQNSPYYIRLEVYNHWAQDFEKYKK